MNALFYGIDFMADKPLRFSGIWQDETLRFWPAEYQAETDQGLYSRAFFKYRTVSIDAIVLSFCINVIL